MGLEKGSGSVHFELRHCCMEIESAIQILKQWQKALFSKASYIFCKSLFTAKSNSCSNWIASEHDKSLIISRFHSKVCHSLLKCFSSHQLYCFSIKEHVRMVLRLSPLMGKQVNTVNKNINHNLLKVYASDITANFFSKRLGENFQQLNPKNLFLMRTLLTQ